MQRARENAMYSCIAWTCDLRLEFESNYGANKVLDNTTNIMENRAKRVYI
jgi:hypothetical protein